MSKKEIVRVTLYSFLGMILGLFATWYVIVVVTLWLAWLNVSTYRSRGLAALGIFWLLPLSVVFLALVWGIYFWQTGVRFPVADLVTSIKPLLIR